MALNKLKYNSLNLTPAANKAISFDSDADALEATLGGGAMTFIKKLTASSSSTLSFVDGTSSVVLDNTYKEYIFVGTNIHAASDGTVLTVGFRDGGSDYDATKTTTSFRVYHDEGDSQTAVAYVASQDLAQGTGFQPIIIDMGTDNDQSGCFILHLFNPSSTTFVKHFTSTMQNYHNADLSNQLYVGGYCNVTAAIDGVQFKMSSGNIDAGTITLYGIN
jgi:hypothetical protein